MPLSATDRDRLREIKTFPSLIKYLRDDLEWPIESDSFDEISFDYTAEELGIDEKTAAKIQDIKQLRPLTTGQPWGIFFIKFEPRRLPVVALRRILSKLIVKKRASANKSDQAAWDKHDLLFISNYGEGDERQITFAHFTDNTDYNDLDVLKVLGWDNDDTVLTLDHVHDVLHEKLKWPDNASALDSWRKQWRSAFELKHREVVTSSKQLAVRLAELATSIRKRCNAALRIENERGPLTQLMNAFKQALIHDLKPDDFADMYAQTIAYGLLSARASRPGGLVAENIADMVPVTNPFLKDLMLTFLTVGGRKWNESKGKLTGIDFDELGINDVVDTLREHNISAILRDFGNQSTGEDPVIYFYEDFLKEYDAKKRMQRGVFYTPKPVVSYIVRSVHELLQTEFGLADGLADTTTWAEMLKRFPPLPSGEGRGEGAREGLKLPEIEVVDPKTREVSKKPIDASTPFVQILDPATGTATFLVEVIDIIHKTMIAKWKKEGVSELFIDRNWNDYVPKHLLPRLHGYELMMAPYAIAHMKIGLKLFETGYEFGSGERARIYLTNALEPPQDFSDTFEQMAPALAHEAKAVNDVKRHQRFTVVIGNPPYSEKSKNEGEWICDLMERYKTTIRAAEAQIKTVSNDYVKFVRLFQYIVDQTGVGMVGVITSNGYLDGILFRDLRQAWLESFTSTDILNLHGSGRRGDAAENDENVFDILQGVTISIAASKPDPAPARVNYSELLGSREHKYQRLLERNRPVSKIKVPAVPALYLFVPADALNAHLRTFSVAAIFGTGDPGRDRNKTYAGGFKTRQDSFTVAFDEATLRERIRELADPSHSEDELRRKYGLCSTAHFEFDKARAAARSGSLDTGIRTVRYRAFDDRPMIWAREVLCEPQLEVTRHLLKPNLCLVTSRVVKDDAFRHVTVSRGPVEVISLSSSTSTNAYMFPLYRYDAINIVGRGEQLAQVINLSPTFLRELKDATGLTVTKGSSENGELRPEQVLHYIYAVLHAPSYRTQFAGDLLRDFPHVPLPSSGGMFQAMASIGGELVELHLLEREHLDGSIAIYNGPKIPQVERASHANGTVWLDKKQTCGFAGVPEAVWNFHIGGYQVCEKWLKDRKGRSLSKDDISHYQEIVVALSETIRLMKEIDETIEKHGGWPGAFVTTPREAENSTGAAADPATAPQSQSRFTDPIQWEAVGDKPKEDSPPFA